MPTFESYGAVAVAACASLSFISTLSLGSYIAYLVLAYRGIDTSSTPASTGIRFLRSQAGYLFVNLLAADFTQALGFGLSWVWAGAGKIDHTRHICTFQALAIESGDVASAVFSLYIALHTAAMLTMDKKPNETFLRVACTCAWIFVAVMTALGPLAIAEPDKGQFYAGAGNWCWISDSYSDFRLWFHYLFIFISAAGQLISYVAIFIIIRFGITIRKKKITDVEQEKTMGSHGSSPIYTTKALTSPQTPPPAHGAKAGGRPNTGNSTLRRKLDKTSLLMLLYPLVNLAVILPLSVFRLAGLAGQHGSPQALAVCGCIFALGGLANTILYSFSRRILSFQVKKCTIVPVVDNYGTPTYAIHMYSPPLLDTPASDRTRVNTTTPYAYTSDSATKLRELRLSPNGSTTSLVEKPQSAALLLPAVKLERAGSRNGTGMRSISPGSYNGTGSGEGDMEGGRSRPQSRNALGPFADMTLLKVDQEVVVWSEK